jgi:hypothetical protein
MILEKLNPHPFSLLVQFVAQTINLNLSLLFVPVLIPIRDVSHLVAQEIEQACQIGETPAIPCVRTFQGGPPDGVLALSRSPQAQ